MKKSLFWKSRNIRLVVTGQMVSYLCTIIQTFAFSLYILNTTGSSALFASVLALSIIPKVITAPIAGVLADRVDRKKIIVVSDILSSLFLLSILGLSKLTGFSLAYVYVIVLGISIISQFFNAGINAIIPSIVEEDNLMSANSLISLVRNISNLLGPIIASLLILNLNIEFIIFLNAISFLLSAMFESRLQHRVCSKGIAKKVRIFVDFKEGIKYIITDRKAVVILLSISIINFLLTPVITVGINYVVKVEMSISDFQYGVMQSVIFAGTFIGYILVKPLSGSKGLKISYEYFIAAIGIMVAVIGFSLYEFVSVDNNSYLFVLITVICMIISSISILINIDLATKFQKKIPNEYLGRMSSVITMSSTVLIPFGQLIMGVMFGVINSGLLIFVTGALIFTIISIIIKLDKEVQPTMAKQAI